MNANWKNFLLAQQAHIAADGDISFPGGTDADAPAFYPLPHLAVLTVTGKDAAKLLQGQCTCDINAISASQGGIGAFCNAKGRVIATFLIAKQGTTFLLVLPADLTDGVVQHLQRYVLRAEVVIADDSDAYCLLGLGGVMPTMADYPLPQRVYEVTHAGGDLLLLFPSTPPRYLLLASADSVQIHWKVLTGQGFKPADSVQWRHEDIDAGFPWLDLMSSGQFIPQMLNLDRLGGISFHKGCYTGQEVVARTQYLGTVKRHLYLAECSARASLAPDMGIVVIDADDEPVEVGKLLSAYLTESTWHLLAVLQTAYADAQNLRLQNANQDRIDVKPLSYVTESMQQPA